MYIHFLKKKLFILINNMFCCMQLNNLTYYIAMVIDRSYGGRSNSDLHKYQVFFFFFFSSPEPLGSQGELIGWP